MVVSIFTDLNKLSYRYPQSYGKNNENFEKNV